jgi:hypothetical protein
MISQFLKHTAILGLLLPLVACAVSTSDETDQTSSELNAYVACGGVLKKKNSSVDACYDGVCAKSNGHDAGTLSSCGTTSSSSCSSSSCGYEWQCVELVNRYMHVVFGDARVHGDAGCTMCENFDASSAYTVYYKESCGSHTKSNYKPVGGDALVWNGHTALVTSTTSTSIHFIQQNAGSYYGSDTVSWSTSTSPDTFGSLGGMGPACVIHEKSNVCEPGDTTTSGCDYGEHKNCSAKHAWGACTCDPGDTRICSSPDCCGTCGHATQTCSSSHTWITGSCQNGC